MTARAKGFSKCRVRQHHANGPAAPDVAGDVARLKRQDDLASGVRVRAEIDVGLRLLLGLPARQTQRDRGRALQRRARPFEHVGPRPVLRRIGRRLLLLHFLDLGFGGDDAVVVLHRVVELQRAALGARRVLGERDLGRLIRHDVEGPAGELGAGDQHTYLGRFPELVAQLGDLAARARRLARLRRLCRHVLLFGGAFGQYLQARRAQTAARGAHDEDAALGHRDQLRFLRRHGAAACAVGEHDGRAPRVGGRRDPGVETCRGERHRRLEAERGADAIGRAVAHERKQGDDAQQQQRAQGDRVGAVGARLRLADAQTRQHGGKARAVRLPQGVGARVIRVGRDGVLVGGRRAVGHARDALDAPHGFLVGGEGHARGKDQRRDRADRKGDEQDEVHGLGKVRPDAEQGYDEEQARDAQDQPQPRPQALEEQRPAARGDLARELGVEGRRRNLAALPCATIPGFGPARLAAALSQPIKVSTDVHHKLLRERRQFKGRVRPIGGLPRTRTSRHPLPYFKVSRVTAGRGDRSPVRVRGFSSDPNPRAGLVWPLARKQKWCSPSDSNRDCPTL